MKILWFSRGYGWGHSVRDFEIIKKLECQSPEIAKAIDLYSNDDGFNAFNKMNIKCQHIDYSEDDSPSKKISKLVEKINKIKPKYIISDEEMLVPVIAKGFNIHCDLISNWIPFSGAYIKDAFHSADTIYLTEYPDFMKIYSLEYKEKIKYTGPIFKEIFTQPNIKQYEQNIIRILISLGGRSDSNAITENISIIENIIEISKSFENVNFIIHIINESIAQIKPIESQKKLQILYSPFIDNIALESKNNDFVITSGGLNSLWEFISSSAYILALPRSDNPMETYYSMTMKNRGLLDYTFIKSTDFKSKINEYIQSCKSNEMNEKKIKLFIEQQKIKYPSLTGSSFIASCITNTANSIFNND